MGSEYNDSCRSDDYHDDHRDQYRFRGSQGMHMEAGQYPLSRKKQSYHGSNYRVGSPESVAPLEPVSQSIGPTPSPSTSTWPDKVYSLLNNSTFLETVKRESHSVAKFAAKLNCKIFTLEERKQSNVSGSHEKKKFDPQKILAIQNATFATYPTDMKNKSLIWKNCIKGIDEINRRLLRKS